MTITSPLHHQAMKFGLWLLFLLCYMPQAMARKPRISTLEIFLNGKLSCIKTYDTLGNAMFSKLDGANVDNMGVPAGTEISVSTYDSSNREIRSISVNSRFGFSLMETKYKPGYIYHYENHLDTAIIYDVLNDIRSSEGLVQLFGLIYLDTGHPTLFSIDGLDTSNNVIVTYSIGEKNGDTTSKVSYRYNRNHKQVYFRMQDRDTSSGWNWEIFSVYNDQSRLIKSFRTEHNGTDTTEVYTYHYDLTSRLLSDDFYNGKEFETRTRYCYNARGQLIKTLFYEGEEAVVDAITNYWYNREGYVSRKIVTNLRGIPADGDKEIYSYKYTYW